MIDCTLVVGVDEYHLRQLKAVWPTWLRHKPSLLQMPMLVFFDHDQVGLSQIFSAVDHPLLMPVPWPDPSWIRYSGGADKWTDPQREKMLSGFVHVPAMHVETKYWLKLDTDVVATGMDDWIDEEWFASEPAIVAHPWGFTKPPDQMAKLDRWASQIEFETPPLNLVVAVGSDRICHKRIISWCGFFSTELTMAAARMSKVTCGEGHLPVPSQDGLLWYVAQRMSLEVKRENMKKRGWAHWSTMANVEAAAKRSLGESMWC